tara:strand:+ start:739 stop:1116 length:378 start_codon:yes stop_codon:yes gene_type:complete
MKNILILLLLTLSISCKQKALEVKTIEFTVPEQIILNPKNLIKSELKITGMSCAIGCAATIEKKLNSTPGIQLAKVNFEEANAEIVFDPNLIQDEEIDSVVKSVGNAYKVTKNERVKLFNKIKIE